ncbi:MAG: alpha-hydroxy-acid oxidizing enzyme [Acidobacteria bacterium]|nr:MAG: alpha-hydroxy-acid oxidizing enzyme [Acidobacteriota bacterium]
MSSRITRRESLLAGAALAVGGIVGSANDSFPAAPQSPSNIADATSLPQVEAVAREKIPPAIYEWINGGAADQNTVRWNHEAYSRIRLQPSVLVDVSKIDTRINLFGKELPFPILLAPTGGHRLFHPEGEMATVRGAGAASAAVVMSSASTFSIEDITKAATGPVWLQFFIKPDRAFTKDLVQRAEAAGCQALCVTVDDPITGVRDWTRRDQAAMPRLDRPNGPGASSAKFEPSADNYSPIAPDKVTWESIDWLRSFARVPVLLKGVLNPTDADRAVQVGASGLIVSNHGGRQLDTVPATVDALPFVVEKVAGRMPVLVDGGIRRGTDVLKALALGASAVLIGRPYLFGLALDGSKGVTRVINLIRSEFENAMALSGRRSIRSIDRSVMWPV